MLAAASLNQQRDRRQVIEDYFRASGLAGYDLELVVHAGAGAYICGEETALLDSLEGRRGQPRLKPPFPAVAGLYASPTVVNNVESIASVPLIVGTGTGSELRQPLGIVIAGGLIVSQVLTLFTTPVIYLAFDRLERRLSGRRAGGADSVEALP